MQRHREYFRPDAPIGWAGGEGAVMGATLQDMAAKGKQVQTPEQLAAAELVREARERGVSLTGPDGLLRQLTKTVIEIALDEERRAPGLREA